MPDVKLIYRGFEKTLYIPENIELPRTLVTLEFHRDFQTIRQELWTFIKIGDRVYEFAHSNTAQEEEDKQ